MATKYSRYPKWYNRPWLVIVWCVVCFPVGLYGVWKSGVISKEWKIVATFLIGVAIVVAITPSDDIRAGDIATIGDELKRADPSEFEHEVTHPTPKVSTVNKQKPTFYTSLEAMIAEHGLVSSVNGTFRVISKNPLHIQVSANGNDYLHPDLLRPMSAAIAIKVVAEIFAATGIQEVKITSVPLVSGNAIRKNFKYNTAAGCEGTIKKEVARRVLKHEIGIAEFEDLLGVKEDGTFYKDSPNEHFEKFSREATAVNIFEQLIGG